MGIYSSIPPFRSNEQLTADKLNRILERLPKNFIAGKGIRIWRNNGDITIGANTTPAPIGGAAAPTVETEWFQIKSDTVFTDYIEAYLYNMATGAANTATTYKIALPYDLRKTPFNGNNISVFDGYITYSYATTNHQRHATFYTGGVDTYTEDQIIVMPYYAGGLISASKRATGVTYVESEVTKNVEWQDENQGCRRWAKL